MVSPAGFEPVYLPVMSGALLPFKLETHKTHVLRLACYSFSRVNSKELNCLAFVFYIG